MDKFDISKLRDLPIEGVAERLGLRVQKHKALCPFHEDSHPSLTFNVNRNTFKCYVCEAHGGVIDLAMHQLKKPFIEACQWLANEHNVLFSEWQPAKKKETPKPKLDIEWLAGLVARPELTPEAQTFLYDERKIDPRVVHWLGISSISHPTPCWRYGRPYFDAPSLLIPYRDIEGNLLSVQSRYLGHAPLKGETERVPRFRFPRGGKCGIFNLPILKHLQPGEPLFISEGVTDCMALLSAGHKAIAIPSASLLSREDKKLLKDFSSSLSSSLSSSSSSSSSLNLHMYPDADIPGEKLYFELVSLANELGSCLTRHSLPPDCKDFSDYYIKTQAS